MYCKKSITSLAAALCTTLLFTSQLVASPAQVDHVDITPQCDVLSIPTNVDEIGDFNVFPPGEQLDAVPAGVANPGCLFTDDPSALDLAVEIRNLTNKDFAEVWYVANPDTDISNYDGLANDLGFPLGHEAFRIDNVFSDPGGANHSLISETGPLDGVWQAGETWVFVLQDYFNLFGISAAAIDSIGVGDASPLSGTANPSSGSIIARVPEPATCSLLLCGVAGMCMRRKLGC